jgi:photosystem II stability/assembly factor-like uncharacterized protein
MKKLIFTLIVVFICSVSYSQSGWYQVYTPPANKSIHSIQFTSENTGYASLWGYSGTGGGLLKTTNGGVNWVNKTPTGNAWAFCFLDDNTGYVDFWNSITNPIIKTTNGGINWIYQDSVYSLCGIEFFDYNTGFAAGKYGGGKKTTNGGINWVQMGFGCWHQWATISCLSADRWIVACDFICKTTNGGMNWTSINGVAAAAIYFINNTTGFVGGDNGAIIKTTNAGDNWFALDTIISDLNPLNIMFVNENTGYLSAHYNQVYKTTDGGYNWSQQVINSSNSIEYVYFINPNTGYAGGGNGAIYKTTTGGTVFVNNISTEVPSAYSLGQNYPNPFNPVTKIKFDIPRWRGEGGWTSLKIYDITGREIQTLVNEKLQPGSYEVSFDSSALSSGVYFYKMTAGDYSKARRMIILK